MAAWKSEKSNGSRPDVLAALRGTVRLESCFPPFFERGGVVLRVRMGWSGGWLVGGGRSLQPEHACDKGHGRTGDR